MRRRRLTFGPDRAPSWRVVLARGHDSRLHRRYTGAILVALFPSRGSVSSREVIYAPETAAHTCRAPS